MKFGLRDLNKNELPDQPRENISISPGGVTREVTSNDKGHFSFRETTSPNGTYHIESDLKTQCFVNTDNETGIKGNDIKDVGGNSSKIVTGLNETVTGSQYTVVGSTEMYQGNWQELANKAQLKLVSTRSMPDKVPDTSLLAPLTDLMKPAPNLLQSVVQPPASELSSKAKISVPSGGGLGMSIFTELANYASKMTAIMSAVSLETAKEMVKVQANYMKDSATQSLKSKQKMFSKLSGPSKEAFKENFGSILAPNGEFTLEGGVNAISTVSDPSKLIGLFMPLTPPQDEDKMVDAYDGEQAKGEVFNKHFSDVVEAERHMC